jgi:hypothetical protein
MRCLRSTPEAMSAATRSPLDREPSSRPAALTNPSGRHQADTVTRSGSSCGSGGVP